MKKSRIDALIVCLCLLASSSLFARNEKDGRLKSPRERISINEGWRFFKYESAENADRLIYEVRPEVTDITENKVADAKPTEAVEVNSMQKVLKPWILPSANDFINDPAKKHTRPEGNPGGDFPFVQKTFDDSVWERINLPHDWAISSPFQKGPNPEVGGGMGRLPVDGVAWYRKKLDIPSTDAGKSIFLDVDGAMSYAIVWLNGKLVGGWPYGYNSFRLNLTPFINPGGDNQLAIRIDNPNHSARWYPGGGIYRNVWLVKTSPVHVAQYGTFITTKDVTKQSATINLRLSIDNHSEINETVEQLTEIFTLDAQGRRVGKAVATFSSRDIQVESEKNISIDGSFPIQKPRLWGPPPTQQPNLYLAVTSLTTGGKLVDQYETRFGIRTIEYNPDKGIIVNEELVRIKGVNQHHDLGALGAAFNTRAAERQLEILQEMGCNAIRFAHNPPAPELLELTDRMGFLVINEVFDSWERKKTPHDFHLIFPDWSEADTRAFVRRDRNCPSVIIWSFGNEVGEQYTGEAGATVAKRLYDFVKDEDSTRPTTCAMNFAKSDMKLPEIPDLIGLNYQGEGIRQDPAFEGTDRIRTAPQYDAFHAKFPNKVILSTETASAFSSRGIYFFPVTKSTSAPVRDGNGGDSKICQVSSYELHAVDFGSSVDKVFGSLERHPFVAGEFVWNGFDYLGEPTPYYEARSSYSGMVDLAGFRKDRFFLYQSHWRPELPMVHILPHWNWPERVGMITPVHVFTSGDEAELFLNGKSLGRKKKDDYEYRLRWDDVIYEPGELNVVAYKDGKKWAQEIVKTTGQAEQLQATADRNQIHADGKDLSFITVKITDQDGLMIPRSNQLIKFSIEGPGEIVATDNGNSYDLSSFAAHQREAFNGMALVIVRARSGEQGTITVKSNSAGLKGAIAKIQVKSCK
jgi:beta-galactosidase